ncbi:MAG: A/G-specific adenine glycosylase [Duodenibacillus sp.]|nr:A/G-specific adenine glycosylase [Duodenibacillus sp.]
MVATDDFSGFSQALIRWQKSFGRHNLPWQVTDPYRRWLSEIMLQQTQVSVVADYFARFIAAYPTLKDLAQADEDDVMRLWAGLGYYSRARNLLACAKVLVRDWGGVFPQHVKDLMTLPGIGQSTAGAVASFSFDAQAPIMDGNVKRVFARVLALATPLEVAATQKTLWEFAQARVPKKDPGIYNQALMDIGSLVCTRTNPKCETCPIRAWCKAFALGQPLLFPVRKEKRAKPEKETCMLLYTHGDRLWLTKREGNGVWRGLWSLPERPSCSGEPIATFLHTFSHYRLHARIYEIAWPDGKTDPGKGKWIAWSDIEAEALAAPVKRALLALRAQLPDFVFSV